MKKAFLFFVFSFFLLARSLSANDYRIESSEFLFDDLPHESCHASTIAETKNGLVACWFGGVREGHQSVGIWISRQSGDRWTKPTELVNGNQKDGKRFPCWNPVLFQMPNGELFLFYKVGPNPREWWGRMMKSSDGGASWSESKKLPKGILGPIKNKPILLDDGRLLCGSSTEHDGWKVHLEWSNNPWNVESWQKSESLSNAASRGAIQPTLLKRKVGYSMLCRNQQRESILSSHSSDGKNWTELAAINLPNPNSGIDAVSLRNGSHLLVYNHTQAGRSPISIAVAKEPEAKNLEWTKLLDLESEPKQEFSYPAIIQTKDGRVHITYTWKRKKIKHVVVVKK